MTDTYAAIIDGAAVALRPGAGFTDAQGRQHAGNVVRLWSASKLAAIGVYRVPAPDPVADGFRQTGLTLGLVLNRPVWIQTVEAIPLAELKATRLAQAEAVYAERLAVGFPVTLDGQAETLQLRNAEDRTNWLGVLIGAQAASALGGGAADYPTKIRTTSNAGYTITNDAAIGLMFQLLGWAATMFGVRSAHKDAIAAAADAEALAAIDLDAGWP